MLKICINTVLYEKRNRKEHWKIHNKGLLTMSLCVLTLVLEDLEIRSEVRSDPALIQSAELQSYLWYLQVPLSLYLSCRIFLLLISYLMHSRHMEWQIIYIQTISLAKLNVSLYVFSVTHVPMKQIIVKLCYILLHEQIIMKGIPYLSDVELTLASICSLLDLFIFNRYVSIPAFSNAVSILLSIFDIFFPN